MITEYLIGLGTSIATFFGTLFQTWTIPDWATNGLSGLHDFLLSAAGLGVWFPWQVLSIVVGGLVTLYGIGFAAKLVQKIWGLVPVVGGSG